MTGRRLMVAAGILAAAVLVPAGAAHAHHPQIVGNATCNEGRWSITWTVTPDAVRGKEWRLTVPQVTGWQADRLPFTLTTSAPGTATSAAVTVSASWRPDGPVDVQRTGVVQLAGTCVPATTTVPPTTIPPTTVAPTTVPVTTVPEPSTTMSAPPETTVPEPTFPPPTTVPETAPPPVVVSTLPPTGSGALEGAMGLLGVWAILTGGLLVWLTKAKHR